MVQDSEGKQPIHLQLIFTQKQVCTRTILWILYHKHASENNGTQCSLWKVRQYGSVNLIWNLVWRGNQDN